MKRLKNSSHLVLAVFLLQFLLWPHPATALTEDEKNTIEIVKKNVNAVVFITNIQYSRDFFFGSQEVQRGSHAYDAGIRGMGLDTHSINL